MFKVKEVLNYNNTTDLMFSKVKENWLDSEVKMVSNLWELFVI